MQADEHRRISLQTSNSHDMASNPPQVAGYPEAHPDVISEDPEKMKEAYWSDIHYLKEKVRRFARLCSVASFMSLLCSCQWVCVIGPSSKQALTVCIYMQVDAGGEVVVTQLFYDVEIFLQFLKDCRSVGITVPIIPGVLRLKSVGSSRACNTARAVAVSTFDATE